MLSAIFDGLTWIIDKIAFVLDFIVWFVESAIETVVLGAHALASTAVFLMQFPVYWLAPFTAIITIAVIFKVKG